MQKIWDQKESFKLELHRHVTIVHPSSSMRTYQETTILYSAYFSMMKIAYRVDIIAKHLTSSRLPPDDRSKKSK